MVSTDNVLMYPYNEAMYPYNGTMFPYNGTMYPFKETIHAYIATFPIRSKAEIRKPASVEINFH